MLDGVAAMTRFLRRIAAEPDIATVPVMVDSSKWSVIEAGLQQLQGKGVVNSISLKEGEDEFLRQARLVPPLRRGGRRHGLRRAGPGRHRSSGGSRSSRARLRPADRARSGSSPRTSSSTPNIFAIATGMEEHTDYAVAFIEAVAPAQGASCPDARTSGGVSNVSFAFRGNDPVREAIHSVFLYHAIEAGLDMAIVNAGRPARSTTTSSPSSANGSRTSSSTGGPTPRSGCSTIADAVRRRAPGWSAPPRTSPGASARSTSG